MVLSPAELLNHKEYPHIHWKLEAKQKAKCSVGAGRGGPFNISYEIHGEGETKLVFITGLGALKGAWQRQTKDFGHTNGSKYQMLILDNRGSGESDAPKMRYSTSEMALDVLELLDHVGWTDERQLNVIGISLGGMIAQELALLIPERISFLFLTSTCPRLISTVGFLENMQKRIQLFVPKALEAQVATVLSNGYPVEWTDRPDELECVVEPFPTNGDRFAAGEIYKRTTPGVVSKFGFIAQALAAGWHHKSDEQLANLGDRVGRERIVVIHGEQDRMLEFVHGEELLKGLGGEAKGVTKAFYPDMGHVMPIQKRKEFLELVEKFVVKGQALNEKRS